MRILIGPLGGNQGLALQDFASRRPDVAFVNGTSSAQLLDPASNFFSFHSNGAAWTAGLGNLRVHDARLAQGRPSSTTQDDVFNWTQAAGFIAEFCSLGGTITKRIWVPPGTQDYSTLIQQVPRSGMDGFVFATGPETGNRVRQGLPGAAGKHLGEGNPRVILDLGGLQPLHGRVPGLVGGAPVRLGLERLHAPIRRSFPRNLTHAGATSTSSTTTRWRPRSTRWRRSMGISRPESARSCPHSPASG